MLCHRFEDETNTLTWLADQLNSSVVVDVDYECHAETNPGNLTKRRLE